ncbi:MAG: glycosyltransferase family 2 protein [Methanomicrobiales archaeon]|nr:glycosyltransferase family 2 protein [Methanomicrobiales archaeon]
MHTSDETSRGDLAVTAPPDISVIIPSLDEEITIGKCITRIQKACARAGVRAEIIISDSSSDSTPVIARNLGAKVIHPVKRGYGSAYLEAFPHAKGEIIVIGDADNTYDFLELPKLLEPFSRGADLVIGSRFLGEITPGAMTPLHRYLGNPILNWLLNMIFGTHFTDSHSGFRAIRRDALARLPLSSTGMEFASEMLVLAAKAGLRIDEVPIVYYPRVSPSKLHSFADGWRHVRFLLLIKPTPFLVFPGLVFSVIGVTLMITFSLWGNIETNHLHSFILGALILIGGVQVVLSGLLITIYSVIHGYEDRKGLPALIMDYHSLEKFLIAGGSLVLLGIISGIMIIVEWLEAGYGPLFQISSAITSLTLIIVGLQIIFASIFISMMLLNEST